MASLYELRDRSRPGGWRVGLQPRLSLACSVSRLWSKKSADSAVRASCGSSGVWRYSSGGYSAAAVVPTPNAQGGPENKLAERMGGVLKLAELFVWCGYGYVIVMIIVMIIPPCSSNSSLIMLEMQLQ